MRHQNPRPHTFRCPLLNLARCDLARRCRENVPQIARIGGAFEHRMTEPNDETELVVVESLDPNAGVVYCGKPTNRDEFLNLVGVGPAKLEKYGDSFLAVINNS